MSLPDEIYAELCAQADAIDGWSPYVGDKDYPSDGCITVDGSIDLAKLAAAILHGPTLQAVREANDAIGMWLSAALEDEGVCAEMKADINRWFAALKLMEG